MPPIGKTLECPVCSTDPNNPVTHHVIGRDGGIDCVACPNTSPTGAVRYYPAYYMKVLGAGYGVDQIPARAESEADKAARLNAMEAELRGIEEKEAAKQRLVDLEARMRETEAKLASKKGEPAPGDVVTEPTKPPEKAEPVLVGAGSEKPAGATAAPAPEKVRVR